MYIGINVGEDRTFVIAEMDENRKITNITKFWKEGLLWFIEHKRPRIVSLDSPISLSKNLTKAEEQLEIKREQNEELPLNIKYSVDISNKLVSLLGYEIANEENYLDKTKKLISRTYPEAFFRKIVRKELLPISTREGIEQRLYNLKKAGIELDRLILSTDRKTLVRELNSIIGAFNSYSIDKNSVEIYGDKNECQIFVPKYKFIPKERVKRKSKEHKNS
jgi:predicted nuclease with RNAse H fold